MHRSLGGLPAHPKYDALVSGCLPTDVFDAEVEVHQHKHLVFVRRIPSVREITKRVNAAYDKQLGTKIAQALAPDDSRRLRQWETSHWSREAFNLLFSNEGEAGDPALLEDNEAAPEEHVDADAEVHSQVANLFVVKKAGADRSTDCSNFSLRLRKPESLFSLLLEPASDYRTGTYRYYNRKRSGGRPRDEYASAALLARSHGAVTAPESEFDQPMPTLWGLMYELLPPTDRERIESLAGDTGVAESFGHYLKNGFLFASPVIVELYCWYAAFCRARETGNVQQRYLAFLGFMSSKLRGSLALAYFRAALETFEALRESWEGNFKTHWHVLTGLSSPALYASGEVKDRQRLILGFNSPFYPNVLATTSVLQEGVNLHMQCCKVHHYGIAWTPGDNEQRVGRVDRLFGKVNTQLMHHGQAELSIHYPYLARSFDEEQLASFIREKYFVEACMDACRQPRVSAEIDLRHTSDAWRSYLRTPKKDTSVPAPEDPFPYKRDERPAGEYQPHLSDIAVG